MSEMANELAKSTIEHVVHNDEGNEPNGEDEPGPEIFGVNWLELVAALLLGIAGALAAFAAYNGHRVASEGQEAYTESSLTTSTANGYYSDVTSQEVADRSAYLQYEMLPEEPSRNVQVAIELFSPELKVAFDAWDPDAAATPFDTGKYVPADMADAEEQSALAAEQFADGQVLTARADRFDLAVVFFTLALFFAGIANLFKFRHVKLALLVVSALLLLPGLYSVAQGNDWLAM